MDFHKLKRKRLQALSKKHGIPANLKNTEMAIRLASLFENETCTELIVLPDYSDEADVIKDDSVVKKVRFSPENEVFEFTRSVKRCRQRKDVRTRSEGIGNVGESGIELRRSTRIVNKGKAVVGDKENEAIEVPRPSKRVGSGGGIQEECKGTELMALELFEYEADISGSDQDGFMVEKVERRSTRIASKAGTLLPAKRSKLLVDIDDKEDELVKNNVKELVSMVQDNNLEDQRRSTRLKPSSTVVTSQEGEIVKNQTKELSIDCEVQATEDYCRMKVQDASKVEKVPRRSKRGCNNIGVLMDKQPVKAVKLDHLGVKKAPNQFKQREKRLSKLLVDDGQAQKGDKQPKETFGNGSEDKNLLRSLTHTTLANTLGQAVSTSPNPCSVLDTEKDGASVDNLKKSNVSDEMQMDDSFENPIVVEENLVEKKTGETLKKKRDRSAQGNQTPRKLLDQYAHFEQEEADESNVGSRGSSKRSETMNQICVKEKPQGMIENSTFPSDTKAAESVMITENVLNSTPDKSVESSQRTNTQELNTELLEDKREEKLEQDTVLIAAVKENEKEVSSCSVLLSDRLSPASVQYSVSNFKAELVVPTGHVFVKDNASTVVEENTKTMDEILICTPMSELKERTTLEAILENSAECWKEIHPSKADEKSSEMEITKVGCLSAGHCVETIGSSNTMKTVNQELVKDTQKGMTEERSPSTSETKAAEPVMISKNDLDSALKVSGYSLVRCTQDLDSELLEGEHEQKTFLMAVTKKGKGKASSLSKSLVERSEVKTRPDNSSTGCYLSEENATSPASTQLPMRNPKADLGVPTSHIIDKVIVSTVITEENIKTKEDILICIPRYELKEHSSISKLAETEAILENSAECCKETHLSKDDEKGMEYSPSTSETKAAVSVMISENVLETTLESSVDISQRRNIQELHSEVMEGECEEKHEQDTVLMDAIMEKEESSSLSLFLIERSEVNNPAVELLVETTPPPTSVLLAVSNPEAELGDPTAHILVKDIASTVIAKEHINTKSEILITAPTCELKEHSFVVQLAEEKAILENSSECQNEIQSGKDGETDSLKKTIQAENLHGNFSGYNTKNSSVGECVNLEMLDEVKDEILEKSGQRSSFERVFKLNVLELRRCSSTDFTSNSLEENNVSKCFEEDNTEALSQPLPRNNKSSAFDELVIFTTPERKLMLMEQSSEKGQTLAAHSVTQHNDEAVESHAFVFTTPTQVSTLGGAGIDEAGKEDESEVSTGLQNYQPLANSELSETGWQGINSAEKSCLFTSAERQLLYGGSEQKGAVMIGELVGAEFHDGYVVKHPFPENSELDEAAEGEENKSVKLRVDSGIFTSAEKLLETDEGVKGENITAKSHAVSDVLTAEGHFLMMGESEPDEAEKSREKGKALAAESMTEQNDEVGESHAVVFTTPQQVSTLGDAGIHKEHTSANFPDEFDVINTTERHLMSQGKNRVVELHGESGIATISETKFTVEDFKGDRSGMNEENRTVELQRDSGTCSLDTHTLLGNYVSGGGNKLMEFYEERYELAGSLGQDKARKSEGKEVVQLYEKSEMSTGLHSDQPLANSELSETGWQGINSADKSGLFTSVERQLLYGGSEQKEAVKTGENAGAEYHDGYDIPEISELNEAAKGEENKHVELRIGSVTSAEKHLETDEGVKGDNITAKSHAVSDVLTAADGQFLMGESEPDEAENKYRENNDVEMLGESNTSFNSEMHMLFGDSELDGTINMRDYTATTCEESFAFTSPERRQLLGNFEPYSAGKKEQKVVDESVVQESLIADSSGSIASKVSYSHAFYAENETAGAELMPKGSQAEDVVGLDTTQETSNSSREHFSHVDSSSLFDFEIEEAETIMEAERNVSFSSYVALPAKGNSETIDEISHDLEVAGTCSMVSEESGPSTDNQNQMSDALEELALTDINEADELTKNIQKGFEGNFLLNSSGGSYVNVTGKTCILAETEDEDEAAGPVATAFEKTTSLTPDEFTVQNNMNEKDLVMIRREATPEIRKEYLNIDETGAISEMQVRREPSLIYRTQVKPKRHDMKENAPNLKIVHNVNVTAPRTSKRQPLQDLGKN